MVNVINDDDDMLYFLLRKRKRTNIINWRDTVIENELEYKLPNEFKGSIRDYNYNNCYNDLDENTY